MARTQSLNYHLELDDGRIIEPRSLSEFGEGDEGRIEVADGARKYRTRDNIFDIGEIKTEIYLRDHWYEPTSEFSVMQEWSNKNLKKDIFIIGTDITGDEKIAWYCTQCELAKGKKNDFDRNSKAIDFVTYYILPQDVTLINAPANAAGATPAIGKDFSSYV